VVATKALPFVIHTLTILYSQQTVICHGLTVLVKCLEDNGGFELENASGDVTAVGAASIALLPVMFKFVSDAHAAVSSGGTSKDESMDVREGSAKASGGLMDSFQKLHCVTGAISSLARLAPIDFLSGLFKKLMHRLLEEVQSESGDSEKICSLLTLSQALVSSEVLDESSITFLYRALKPLIRNDENGPRVQKRAYKVLTEICERHHSFVAEPDRLQELSVLLAGTIMTSQISARYMRLKCLNIIVEGFGESNTEHVVSRRTLFYSRDGIGI
jgi:ribosomal RNA-processing protein 12